MIQRQVNHNRTALFIRMQLNFYQNPFFNTSDRFFSPKGFYCFPYVPPAEDPNTQLKPYFQKVAMPKQMVGMYKRPDYNAWWILSQDGKIRQVFVHY